METTRHCKYLIATLFGIALLGACSAESIAERALEQAIEAGADGEQVDLDFDLDDEGEATLSIGGQTITVDTENGGVNFDGIDNGGNDESFSISATEQGDTVVVELHDEDGTIVTTSGTQLPDEWPASIQIIDGAQNLTANKADTPDGSVMNAGFTVQASPDDAIGYYQNLFSDWESLGASDTRVDGDVILFNQFQRGEVLGSVRVLGGPGEPTHVDITFLTGTF